MKRRRRESLVRKREEGKGHVKKRGRMVKNESVVERREEMEKRRGKRERGRWK